jgi:hypothetical protein
VPGEKAFVLIASTREELNPIAEQCFFCARFRRAIRDSRNTPRYLCLSVPATSPEPKHLSPLPTIQTCVQRIDEQTEPKPTQSLALMGRSGT